MRKSPVTIQQWVESVQTNATSSPITPSHIYNPPNSPVKRNVKLSRDMSLQSDDASSHCSSVESVLELRRPDPEAVLIGLGFGPPHSNHIKSKIPARFLQPSKLLPHIDINKFLQERGEMPVEQLASAPASPIRPRPKSS